MEDKILFYGVRTGTRSGHFLNAPHGCLPEALHRLDGVWCFPTPRTREQVWNRLYDPRREPQEEGRAHIHDVSGWTVVAWWDRSEDPRAGSNAVFLAPGKHQFSRMIELAREHFPSEMRRMEAAYPIGLAGADLAPDGNDAAAEAFLLSFRALHPAVQAIVARRIRQEIAS